MDIFFNGTDGLRDEADESVTFVGNYGTMYS